MTRTPLILPLLLLAACAPPDLRRDEAGKAPLPIEAYERAAADSAVYRVDPTRSLLLVRVGRAGPAARLGHAHAIASEKVEGFVELNEDPNRSRADLAFALRELVVDKQAYRDRLELDTDPSESDIKGTYANMLKVVTPDAHPWVTINATIAEPGALAIAVTMAGRTVNYVTPYELSEGGDVVTVSGRQVVTHAEFGLEPYSAAGGLLRVADELDVRFEIVATRLSP